MSIINWAICLICGENIVILLEGITKEKALEKIKQTKCPRCDSDEWRFIECQIDFD